MKINSCFAPLGVSRKAVVLSLRTGCIVIALFSLIAAVLLSAPSPQMVFAQEDTANQRPSVLLVDSSLGDYDAFRLHWLGEDTTEVANNGSISLITTNNPLWWSSSASDPNEASAPATFLLGSSTNAPLDAADIVWALDEIAKAEAEPKVFIVALGTSGLQARLYAEDLSETKQSSRADLVGMTFLGTPHQGYSIAQDYPKLSLWASLAQASKLETQDVVPGSEFLANLNASPFPNIVKSLQIDGQVGDLGFGPTDGATVQADLLFPVAVSPQVQNASTRATLSQQVGLSTQWLPLSKVEGQNVKPVDANLAERLSAMDSYVTAQDVQVQTKEFYQAWFADGAPVTHISMVLTLDISGSMLETIDSEDEDVRLDVAKQAAGDFMQVVAIRSEKAYAVPTDITVLAFNTEVSTIATGYDASAISALQGVNARGETNIGIALQASLDALDSAPSSADRHIVFLSDGARTEGQTEEQILSSSVAKAKEDGIAIDTIAFGDMGESDVGFLKEISSSTGGTFYEAKDTYGLRVSFLKAYYTSLGLNLVDTEVDTASGDATLLGQVNENTRSLEIGILADGDTPSFKVLCNNVELAEDSFAVQEGNDGLVTIQVDYPAAGEYSLSFTDAKTRIHVFAVGQLELFKGVDTAVAAQDNSLLFIEIAGGVLLVIIVVLIIATLNSKKKAARSSADSQGATDEFDGGRPAE